MHTLKRLLHTLSKRAVYQKDNMPVYAVYAKSKKIIKNSPSHTKATLQGEPKQRTQMESFQTQDEIYTETSFKKVRNT